MRSRVPRVLLDQPLHLCERDACLWRASSSKVKPMPSRSSPESLARVRSERGRGLVQSALEPDKRRSARTGRPSSAARRTAAFDDMHDRHDHRRLARPLKRRVRGIDRATLLADRAKPGRSRVTLADGVGRDQPEAPSLRKSRSAAKEMRNQVGIAVRPSWSRLEPVKIAARDCRR